MNGALLKTLVALVPVSALIGGSAVLFFREKSFYAFLQLFGAACLLVAVLTHLCEALGVFPSMGWGRERSAGHYLDFWSASLGLILFPLGYLFHAFAGRNTERT
jgi:hypothetical protein